MKQLFIAKKLDNGKFKLLSKIQLFKPPYKTISMEGKKIRKLKNYEKT